MPHKPAVPLAAVRNRDPTTAMQCYQLTALDKASMSGACKKIPSGGLHKHLFMVHLHNSMAG
jgi:hypothetical protein